MAFVVQTQFGLSPAYSDTLRTRPARPFASGANRSNEGIAVPLAPPAADPLQSPGLSAHPASVDLNLNSPGRIARIGCSRPRSGPCRLRWCRGSGRIARDTAPGCRPWAFAPHRARRHAGSCRFVQAGFLGRVRLVGRPNEGHTARRRSPAVVFERQLHSRFRSRSGGIAGGSVPAAGPSRPAAATAAINEIVARRESAVIASMMEPNFGLFTAKKICRSATPACQAGAGRAPMALRRIESHRIVAPYLMRRSLRS